MKRFNQLIRTGVERGFSDARISGDTARSVAHIRIGINLFCTILGLYPTIRFLPGRSPDFWFWDLSPIPQPKGDCGLKPCSVIGKTVPGPDYGIYCPG